MSLLRIDQCCSEIDLHLRPDKCISLIFTGKRFDKKTTVKLKTGNTCNISEKPSRMLGKIFASSGSTSTPPCTQLLAKFKSSITQLDKRPIRGEYKLWIYRHYLAPSLNFFLAINTITKHVLTKMEAMATKMLKKWLNLPRNATKAILYHPSLLNCPQVSYLYLKASLGYLAALESSNDSTITELLPLLDSKKLRRSLGFPSECFDILEAGRNSVSSIPSLKKLCKQSVIDLKSTHWNSHLQSLSVQNKFADVVTLENQPEHVRKKIVNFGLPRGQLSFLLKAALDTLPTPLNLKRMKIQCSSKCYLCSNPRPTTAHILNGCNVALDQGRFTWRHDSVLKVLSSSLKQRVCSKSNDKELYADLQGYRYQNSPPTTIPSTILVTPLRPDLVILNNPSKNIHILELTVPTNTTQGIQNACTRKQSKEAYLSPIEDISSCKWLVTYRP